MAFVLSLLAACGIHAVVLLMPRAARTEEAPIPTIELDLEAAPVRPEGPPAMTRAVASRAVAVRTPAETQTARVEAVTPEASRSPVPTEPTAAAAPDERSVASFAASVIMGSGAGPAGEGDAAAETSARSGSQGGAESGAPASAQADFIPPRPRAEILPTYPRSARRAGLEGVVKVSVMVDSSGAVTNAVVLATSGHAALDQAALEAVRRAQFAPALQDGRPAPCRIVIPIRFRLQSP